MGDFKKWGGDPSNGGNDSEMGGLIPLYGLCISWRGLWIELQWGGGLAQVGDKAQRWESLKV